MSVQSRTGRSASGTSNQGLPGSKTGGAASPKIIRRGKQPEHEQGEPAGPLSLEELAEAARQEERAELQAEQAELDEQSSTMTRKERKTLEKAERRLKGSFEDYPHLDDLRPVQGYVFQSDYFIVDQQYATIMSFFHDDAARDDYGAFWGINRITAGLDERVTTVILEQVTRMGEKWITDHQGTAERLDKMDASEQEGDGATRKTKRRQQKVSQDMEVVVDELVNGASYLHVHMRLMVKAPSLAVLDDSIERIKSLYVDRFGTLKIAPYHGEQRRELASLFQRNSAKRGKGFYFTSKEFAGAHSLVTNGLIDDRGEYIGYMIGDVNNSAIVQDLNDFKERVVVADEEQNDFMNRAYVSDMWGSKISQSALLNNHRVVHIVLNGAKMDELGPRLDGLTARLDMSSGDINMFEMFGKQEDELSIFPTHLYKIVLMAEQAYETTDSDRSTIRGSLEDTLTQFYVDKNMWSRDAKHNRDRLRLVGVPHDQVPRLQDIVTYFETQYKSLSERETRDDELLHAYSVLRLTFKNLLDNNGDLFNTFTSDSIDDVENAQRVIYDFSGLIRRGVGIAMAQLVNVIGFAVDSLDRDDVVIIHGADDIADTSREGETGVKEYITTQLNHLVRRGGRVVYLYNDIERMLNDADFNRFDRADYTLLGAMSDAVVTKYQKTLHQEIPPDLEQLVTSRDKNYTYLRRGHTNVVFQMDIPLGTNPARAQRREALHAQADTIAAGKPQATVGFGAGRVEDDTKTLSGDRQVTDDTQHQPAAPRYMMRRQRTIPARGQTDTPARSGRPVRQMRRNRG